MKKLVRILMVCILLLAVSNKLFAEDIVYKTLDFAKVKMQKCNTYSAKWTATNGEDSWELDKFSNYNLTWKYVRCGTKDFASFPSIVNKQPYEKAVNKIEITVDEINPNIVKSAQILVSSDSNFNKDIQKVDFTTIFQKGGLVTCSIPQSKPNRYYKITLSLKQNTVQKNGPIQISKIVYYTSDNSPHISGSTTFLDSTSVTLSTENQDAKIYYTIDGTEPTDQSTVYTAPFSLNASTAVKAVAYINGEKSKMASQYFKKVEENELISVAQALKTADNTQVYIKAKVAKTEIYNSNSSSPTLNYYIADNENAGETLEILNGSYLQNNKISNAFQIVRGDEVVVAATVNTDNGHKTLKNANLLSIKEYQDQAKVTTAGWATFVSRRAVDFSKNNDISAYLVKYNDSDNRVTLTPVTTIPGNTAVVVKANAGTYELQRSKENTTIVNNDLKYKETNMKVTTAFSVYVLSKQGNGCGFYPVKVNDTIAPFKGFLTVNTASTVAAKPFYAIGNTTTGISNTVEENKNMEGVHYNLAGQRVNSNYKGLVIVNGHKVIIK